MKRLAIFSGSDMRNFVGGEKYLMEFAKRLPEYDITIFSFNGKGPFRLTREGVQKLTSAKIRYYNAFEVPIAKERLMLTASGIATIRSLKDFDVLYCIDNSVFTELLLAFASKRYGFRYVLGIHDANILREAPLKPSFGRSVLLGLYKPLRNFAIMAAPNVRTINASDGEKLKRMGYRGSVYAVTDFVNIELGGRNRIHVDNKRFVALFVGRLKIEHKGVDLLCSVVEKVLKKNNKIIFRIIGSGEDGESLVSELAKKYPKNVEWLGFVDDKALAKAFLDSSLMVFTSRFESLGVSLVEGQGYGLPAVAFNVRGPDVTMRDDRQGKLVRPFDVDAFSTEVLRYYDLWSKDKAGYLKLKSEISKIILSRFGENVIMPRLRKMLKQGDMDD